MDDLVHSLRKLAKSSYYQVLYSQAKELKLNIFENTNNFTELQVSFLNYLSFYNNLYLDYSLGEVSEFIFTDEIYEDAYIYYKNKKRRKTENKDMPTKNKQENVKPSSQWVFRAGKK